MWPFKRKKYVLFSPVMSGYYADPKHDLVEIWTSDIDKAMTFDDELEALDVAIGIAQRGVLAIPIKK